MFKPTMKICLILGEKSLGEMKAEFMVNRKLVCHRMTKPERGQLVAETVDGGTTGVTVEK